jgi:hypothetical protein
MESLMAVPIHHLDWSRFLEIVAVADGLQAPTVPAVANVLATFVLLHSEVPIGLAMHPIVLLDEHDMYSELQLIAGQDDL